MTEIKPDTSLYSDLPSRLRALALVLEGPPDHIEARSTEIGWHPLGMPAYPPGAASNVAEGECDYRLKPEPRVVWVNFYDNPLCRAYHYDSEEKAKLAAAHNAIGTAVRVELPE